MLVIPRPLAATAALLSASMLLPTPTLAEVGDYSSGQAFLNLFFPKKANAPFTSADQADIPIAALANPSGFNDGFRPGLYYVWQEVKLDPSTGAKCGDGSPYKFYVNRTPKTSNQLIVMEGGGACWDYKTCQPLLVTNSLQGLLTSVGNLATQLLTTGKFDMMTAVFNSVIPVEQLLLTTGLMSTVATRTGTQITNKVQNWNMVYMPYCTGDTLVGFGTTSYTSADGTKTTVEYHNGIRNLLAVTVWMRNHLERPGQMMATGFSAGGVGSLAAYFFLRNKLSPTYGYLLDDAGPAFPAPLGASTAQYPSIPLHTKIAQVWHWNDVIPSLQGGTTSLMQWMESQLPGFSRTNFGSLNGALSARYPNDRLAFLSANRDYILSSYSYRDFYPELVNDSPNRKELTLAKWNVDMTNLTAALDPLPNFSYYVIEYRRALDSHCLTILDAYNTGIEERGLTLNGFIGNLTTQGAPPIKAREHTNAADYSRTNLMHDLTLMLVQLGGM